MNKDQVNGRAETLKGDVKEAAGKVVGNERLTAEGKADQAAGKVQSKVGDVKNDVGNAVKNAIDR
ncbi:MAG TPA: CsbD family protein [Burkholderiaceae bacterium]